VAITKRPIIPMPAQPSGSSGFTLIEVLVALSLSLVLISAIYSAISLHWRFEEAGRERIERAQISLAVLRLLTEDIGSVAFVPPSGTAEEDADADATAVANTGASASGKTTVASTSATPPTTGTSDTASTTVEVQTSLGIVGTAESLQLDVSHPAREDFVPEVTSGPQPATTLPAMSDNVRVTWGMVTPSTAPAGTNGLRSLTANPALARRMADRLRQAVETDEDQGSDPPPLNESSILAKEIVTLAFRYYDGYVWSNEWDSVKQERLPRAIEVTIGFLKPEFRKPGSLNLPGSETIVPIQHVIFVPASSPVSGEEI